MNVQFLAAIVYGHVATETVVLCVCEELVHEGGEGEAALEVDTRFAVLAEDDIGGGESAGGTDGYAFFARRDLVWLAYEAS